MVFNGKKENDSSNISSFNNVSYLASAKFHKNNFLSAVEKKAKPTSATIDFQTRIGRLRPFQFIKGLLF